MLFLLGDEAGANYMFLVRNGNLQQPHPPYCDFRIEFYEKAIFLVIERVIKYVQAQIKL